VAKHSFARSTLRPICVLESSTKTQKQMDNIMKKDSQNVALLIAAFLQKHNFSKTLAKLQKEANITVNRSGLEELESIFQKHIAAQTSASRKRKRVESSSDESSSDDSSSDESDSSESSTDDSSDDSEPEDFSKKREEIMKQKALDAKVAAENWMNVIFVCSCVCFRNYYLVFFVDLSCK